MSETVPIIDDHHHAITPAQRALFLAGSDGGKIKFPVWTMQSDREAMERLGITGILLSMPGSGTLEQVHQFNNFLAETSREDPRHYGFFANLPYGDPEAALKEMTYVLDTLGEMALLYRVITRASISAMSGWMRSWPNCIDALPSCLSIQGNLLAITYLSLDAMSLSTNSRLILPERL